MPTITTNSNNTIQKFMALVYLSEANFPMTQQRARSRLKSSATTHQTKRSSGGSHSKTTLKYVKHTPLLLFAAAFYAGLYWLLTTIRPEQIKNILLPDSYIPLHLLFFGGNFFLFMFLTVSKRWGIFIALAIEWLLFLKLQEIKLDMWALASALIIGAGGWLLRTLWKKREATL